MQQPGWITVLGSGETSASGGQVFETLARRLSVPLSIGVLETPAGFELNSAQVAGRVADFLRVRLQNYQPRVQLIPARRKGGAFSTDDPALLQPLLDSDLIFLGPGSPSYAVRQLSGSVAWYWVQARQRQGAFLALASAATVAIGAFALPVYEIYKVGEEIHWKPGLDLFGPYGLRLVFVPHWNNNDGGSELDTSRCFMGAERFAVLQTLLPADVTIIGLDEHTALTLDLQRQQCQVLGRDSVHVLRGGKQIDYASEKRFGMELLGDFRLPSDPSEGIPAALWQQALLNQQRKAEQDLAPVIIPDAIKALAERRSRARLERRWEEADILRQQIMALGWTVTDTSTGSDLSPL